MKRPIPAETALRRFGAYTETATARGRGANTDEPSPTAVSSTSSGWTPPTIATKTTTGSVAASQFAGSDQARHHHAQHDLGAREPGRQQRVEALAVALRGDRRWSSERHREQRLNADDQSKGRKAEQGRPGNRGPFPAQSIPEQDAARDDRRDQDHGRHPIMKHRPAPYQGDQRAAEKQAEMHVRALPSSMTFVILSAIR